MGHSGATRPGSGPFSRTHRLSRGFRLVVIAALLFALWYTWPTPVDPDLERLAREHVVEAWPDVRWGRAIRQTGHFGKYALTFEGHRDNQVFQALVTVVVSAEQRRVVEAIIKLGSTSQTPLRLAQLLMTVVIATLVFFYAVPRTFGRKCPRDGALLPLKETIVVRPRYDPTLITRPAIIRRTWSCPKCDFRHAEALRDPNHRPTELIDPRFVVRRYRTSDDEFDLKGMRYGVARPLNGL